MFVHKVAGMMLLLVLCVTARARAENACLEIQNSYNLIKAEAVSVQTNSALFAAADKGCEDFGRKLIAGGASVLARDRLGAMPLAHAARDTRKHARGITKIAAQSASLKSAKALP